MDLKKNLICIVGPTAVGKTNLCLKLAKNFQTVILSSDSRQFYRELELGTAKPSALELQLIPHYFINSISIFDPYDVKQFEREALALLSELFREHDCAIVTGGSGLFVDVLAHGIDELPPIPKNIRKSLDLRFENEGLATLQEQLAKLDPDYHEVVDLKNPQRLIRALEVCLATGQPYSSFRSKKKIQRPFRILWVGLNRDRAELYQRIDQRMEEMIEKGLFEEARKLYPYRDLNALQTVGYTEIFGYLEAQYDKEEAIRLLKRNSRRYAKRQLTWFRKNPEIKWFHPDQYEEILSYLKDQMGV